MSLLSQNSANRNQPIPSNTILFYTHAFHSSVVVLVCLPSSLTIERPSSSASLFSVPSPVVVLVTDPVQTIERFKSSATPYSLMRRACACYYPSLVGW